MIGTGIEARPYQRAAVDALYECWSEGRGDHPLIVAPTGSGKSVILAMLCAEAMEWPGTRVCVVTHQKELVEQDSAAIMRMTDARVGFYNAALGEKSLHHPITVATIQSIYKKAPDADPWDIIIVDEAHMIAPNEGTRYQRFLGEARLQNPDLKIVGLTATPWRMGTGRLDEGKDALFDTTAYEITIPELLGAGHLCEIISVGGVQKIDLSGVKVRGGEYVASDLAKAADKPDTTKAAVAEIVRLGADRKGWLIFTSSIDHGRHVTEEVASHGIPVALVTGDTPQAERAMILRDYRAQRLRCVVNVQVLTTGFDAPHTDLIGALRPTKSPVLYVQMLGRAMRPHPGKENALLLDFAGLVMEHGPVDAVNVRSRGDSDGQPGEAPARECPECRRIVGISVLTCPGCGHEWPPPEPVEKLHTRAFSGAVLSHQRTQELVEVIGMRLSKWEPHDPSRPATLLVSYQTPVREIREWLCPEHTGYARTRFEHRCRTEWKITPPANIAEAIERSDEVPIPSAILVRPQKDNPKFVEVLRRFYGGSDE